MKYSIIFVVVLGLIAAVCMAGIVGFLPAYIRGPLHATTRPAAEVSVLVAAKSLPAMKILDADAVTVKKLPAEAAPENHLSNPVQAIGKVLVLPMTEGQAFTKTCFVSEGSGAHLAAALPEGMRAMAVLLESDASLRSLLYPGCRVDVLASVKAYNGGEARARTLLQNVQILAIEDQTIVSNDKMATESPVLRKELGRKTLVTLMVDPEQAKLLQMAQREGSVSLALRNPLDSSQHLAAEKAEEPPVRPEPQPRTLEMVIMRDGKSEIRKFTLAGSE